MGRMIMDAELQCSTPLSADTGVPERARRREIAITEVSETAER